MATIEKRYDRKGNVTYRVQIRKKGFPGFYNSFKTEEEASEWAKITEESLSSSKNKKFLMKDLFERYEVDILPTKSLSQQKDELPHIEFWKGHLSKMFISDVTSTVIESIADEIYKRRSKRTGMFLSPESRRKYLMTLSFIFNTACIQWKWCEFNPVYSVDKHIQKCKEQTSKKIDINIISETKASFIHGIREAMKENGITSIEELSKFVKMPKESVRKLLSSSSNSTILQMVQLAKGLNKDFRFTYYS